VTTTATKSKKDVVGDIDAALDANAAARDEKPTPHKARSRAPRKATPPPAPAKKTEPKPAPEAEVAPDVQPYALKGFSTREVPWGRIGNIGDAALTAADAAEAGGLNFEVELLDAGFRSGVDADAGWLTVPRRKACVRKDTRQFFSFVSSGYAPVQYGEAFAFMDEISPRYVAAGTLGGGRQGFMVVQLPERKTIELKLGRQVDPLDMYGVLRTSHDLTRAIEVSVMTLRGKCMNALTLSAFTADAVQRWSVKHVGKDPMVKLAVATTTLQRINAYADAFVKTARALHEIKVEMDDATALLRKILPERPKRDEQVNAIVNAWRTSPTNGFPDDGWGLVNAVSEYFEWGRNEGTRTDQSRFTGGLTGATHRFTNRTAQLLLQRRR
jgi:phage/plasmid-like protein (TIGR03299 family)